MQKQSRNRTAARLLAVLLVAGSACVAGVGCGGAGTGASIVGLAPGTTAIRVMNHVDEPDVLDRLAIAIDGEALPLSSVPPPGAGPATLIALKLKPGPHTIAVRATTRVPGGNGHDTVVVGAQQAFHVTVGPAAIVVDVRTAVKGASPFDEHIAVDLAINGGTIEAGIGAPKAEDPFERCAPLLPIPRAMCRAAVELDDAMRRNDVVAALCVRDRLGEMRRLASIGETAEVRSDAALLAERGVTDLSRQIDRCIGDAAGGVQGDGVTTLRRPSR